MSSENNKSDVNSKVPKTVSNKNLLNAAATLTINNTKGELSSDIKEMLFGFGDKWPCDPETVDLVEQLTINYIEELTLRATDVAGLKGGLDKECFMFVVRKDRRKFNRIYQLLNANNELKSIKKVQLKEETI
eukprot:gene8348-11293_t